MAREWILYILLIAGFLSLNNPIASQTPNWDLSVGFSSSSDEWAYDVAVDSVSNLIYLVGAFQDSSVFPSILQSDMNGGDGNGKFDGFLAQLDFNGNLQWVINFSGPELDEATGVEVDLAGNVVVSGFFTDTAVVRSTGRNDTVVRSSLGDEDIFVASYSPSGVLNWVRTAGGINDDRGMDVAVDYFSGQIYLTGYYDGAATFGSTSTNPTYNNRINGFVVSYDQNGNQLWLAEMKSDGDDADRFPLKQLKYAITANDTAAFVVGMFTGDSLEVFNGNGVKVPGMIAVNSDGVEDIFVCGISSSGNWLWASDISNNTAQIRGFGIDVDCQGVYVSGTSHDGARFPGGDTIMSNDHDNPFLVSLNTTTGLQQWLEWWQSGLAHDEVGFSVLADGYGTIYQIGTYGSDPFLQPDTQLTATLQNDIFMTAHSSGTGAFLWGMKVSGDDNDYGFGMALDGLGTLFIAGEFQDTLTTGNSGLKGDNNPNIFAGRLSLTSLNSGVCCPVPPVAGTVSVSSDTLCPGDSLTLQVSGYSGSLLWQVSNDSGATWLGIPGGNVDSLTISPFASRTYYRVVTSIPGCLNTFSDTGTVYVGPVPVPSLGPDTFLCGQDSIVLDPGKGFANYLWSNASGSDTLIVTNPGTFSVIVTDYLGCDKHDTITISQKDPPLVNLGPDTLICDQPNLILDAGAFSGASYFWSNGTTSQTYNTSLPGLYWVSVDTGGCQGRDSIELIFGNSPMVNLGQDTSICPGDTLLLDAGNPGLNFDWGNGISSQTIPVSGAGTYRVLVSDTLGCKRADTIIIQLVALPQLALSGLDSAYCQNDAPGFLIYNPNNALLSGPGINGDFFYPDSAGVGGLYQITLTYTDKSSGCVADSILQTKVDSIPPAANAGPDQTLYGPLPAQLAANQASFFQTSWKLIFGNGSFSSIPSPTSTYSDPDLGTSMLCWSIDGGECGIESDTMVIEILDLIIPDAFSPNGDGINDQFRIEGIERYGSPELIVFNRWGQKLYKSLPYKNDWDGSDTEGAVLTDDTYYFILNLAGDLSVNGYVVIKR